MNSPTDLYDGARPADLRFANYHVLAEYIAQAQRFVDSVSEMQRVAEQLLDESVKTSQSGLAEFKGLLTCVPLMFRKLELALQIFVNCEAARVAQSAQEAQSAGMRILESAGEVAQARFDALDARVDELCKSAAQHEQAAESAVRMRQDAEAFLKALTEYEVRLDKFQAAIRSEEARVYRGASVWRRIEYVFRPPMPSLQRQRAPERPARLHANASARQRTEGGAALEASRPAGPQR